MLLYLMPKILGQSLDHPKASDSIVDALKGALFKNISNNH